MGKQLNSVLPDLLCKVAVQQLVAMENGNNSNGGANRASDGLGAEVADHVAGNGYGGGGGDEALDVQRDQRGDGAGVSQGGRGPNEGGAVEGHGEADQVVTVEVHHEGDLNGTSSNENFSEIIKEGVKGYQCNVCSEIYDQPSKAKRHITRKHLKPAKPANDVKDNKRSREEDMELFENKKHKFVFSESILDEFDKTGAFVTSTQVEAEIVDEDEDEEESPLGDTIVRAVPENVNEAVLIIKGLDLKIKQLEEELKTSKNKVSGLDNIIATKEDALLVFQGTINSLEEEMKNLLARNARLENVVARMKGEIVHLRELKAGGDKNKKLEKDVKEAEAKVAENLKKIEELVMSKAKVEAELVRMTKVCDLQLESLNHGDRKQESLSKVKDNMNMREKDVRKVDVKCRQFENFAKCDYGDGCRYLHSPTLCEYYVKVGKCPVMDCKELHRSQVYNKEEGDCFFWTHEGCKYTETDCNKGRHLTEKRGIYKRKENFLGQGWAGRASGNQQGMGTIPPGMGGQPMMGGLMPVMGGQVRMPIVGSQKSMSGPLPTQGQQQNMFMMGQQHSIMEKQHQGIVENQNSTMVGQQQGAMGLGQQLGTMGQIHGTIGQQQGMIGIQQGMVGQQQGVM